MWGSMCHNLNTCGEIAIFSPHIDGGDDLGPFDGDAAAESGIIVARRGYGVCGGVGV